MAGYENEPAMRGLMMSPEESEWDRQYDLQDQEDRLELEAEMRRGGNSVQRAAREPTRRWSDGGAEADNSQVGWVGAGSAGRDSQVGWVDELAVQPAGSGIAKRGTIPEVLRAIAGGAVTTLPKMINQGLQAFSPAGSAAESFFRNNADNWAQDEQGWAPDMAGHGRVARGFIEAGQQIAPTAVGMAGMLANPIAGAAGIAALYGGSTFTDTYDRATAKGLDPDTAFQAAIRTGGIEAFGEIIGDYMGGKFLKGGAEFIRSRFGEKGLSAALQMAKRPEWAARFGGAMAGNTAVQSGTEYGQAYGQSVVENEYDVSQSDPHERGMHGAEIGGYTSLLLGPFGAAGSRRAGQQRKAIGTALDDTSTPIDVRKLALEQVAKGAESYGAKPEELALWKEAQQERFIQDADSERMGGSGEVVDGEADTQFTRNPYEDERTTQAALVADAAEDDAQAPYISAQEQRGETLRNNIAAAAEQQEYAQLGDALDRHHEEQVLAQMDEAAKAEYLAGLQTAVTHHTEQTDTQTADAASASTAVELLKSSLEAAKVELAKAEKPQFKAPKQVAQKAARVAARAAKVTQLEEQLAAATQAYEESSAAVAHHTNMASVLSKHLTSIGEAAAAKTPAPVGREVNATLQDVAQVQQQLDAMQAKAALIPKGMQVYGRQIEKLKTKLAGMYTGTEGAENANSQTIPAGTVEGQAATSGAVGAQSTVPAGTKRRKTPKDTGSGQAVTNAGAAQTETAQGALGAEAVTNDAASRGGSQKPADKARIAALTRWLRFRAPKLGRDGKLKLDKDGAVADKGRDTRDENVKTTLGSSVVDALTRIHAFIDARDEIMAQFNSGRIYYKGKDGNLHRKTTGKGTGRTKETVYTADREEVEANMQNVYSGKRAQLEHISGELDKLFTALEKELGLRNIQRAQFHSKNRAEGGVQEHDASMFSSAFREWKAGNISAAKPIGAVSSKDIRERKEVGTLAVSKLASVYNDGFKFGGSYEGLVAVLQKLKFHGQNPFAGNIAGRLVSVFEDAQKDPSFQLPTMKFYTAEGLMEFNAKGVMSINTDVQAPAPIAIWDSKTNTIHIGPKGHNSQVVIHEAVHAALAGYVQSNADAPVVKALEALRKHVLAQLKADPKLLDHLGTEEDATAIVVALSEKGAGIQEFLSYGLTHGGLQEAMRNMEMSGSTAVTGFIKSTWNAFVTMTRKILGLPDKYAKAFDQFLHVSGDILTTGWHEKYVGDGLANRAVSGAHHGGLHVDNGVVVPSMTHLAPKKAWLEAPFRALLPALYGSNPKGMKAIDKWAGDMAEGLRKRDPKLASWVSKIYADFNVGPAISKLVQTFKNDRANPVTSANELGSWIMGKANKPNEILKAFAYMDAIEATSQKAARQKFAGQLDDHVLVKVEDAWRALKTAINHETTSDEVRSQLEGLKPSEMLTRALQADNVQGQGLGAREEKIFAGKKVSMPESGIMDLGRPATNTDRFYPVYKKGPNGDMVLDQLVHSARLKEFPTADSKKPFVMVKFNASESRKQGENVTDFRALSTVENLIKDPTLGKDAADTVAMSFLNTVSIMANAVATRKLMRDVADVGAAQKVMFEDEAALRAHLGRSSPVHVEKMRDSASTSVLADESRKPGNWVQFPTNAAFGDLAGKIVEGPVYARISDALNRSAIVDSELYNGLIRTFKGMKTKYSPSTAATNIMGNFTLAYMNNLSLPAVKAGLQLYLKYKVTPGKLSSEELAIMSAFHASGATLGDYSTNEVKKMMYEAMAAKSESSNVGFMNELADWAKYEGSLKQKIVEHAKRTGRRVDDIAGEAYATGDNMFRLAAFMSKMGELQKTHPGMSRAEIQTEAGAYAKKSFLDYDNDSRLLQTLRQGPLPFISWTYAYSGVLADIAKNQPWKLATLALVYSMISGALSASEGDEEKKERIRSHKDDTTWFGAHKSWNLGTHNGRSVYFDAAKWFSPTPLEFSDAPNGFMGFHSWPSALTPNNPIFTSAMYMFGYDPYLGKPISKDTATDAERAIANIGKVVTQFTPPAVSGRILGPKPDVLGRPGDAAVHYARLFAAPVTAVDRAASKKGLELEIKRVERAFNQEISNAKRNANLGKIPRADSLEAIKGLEARKKERLAALKEGM